MLQHYAHNLFNVWCEPCTLIGLCIEMGRTLNADVVDRVLAQLRCMSMEEALMRTNLRAYVYGIGPRAVFPAPDPFKKRYYLSDANPRGSSVIVIQARSVWRGTRSRNLCYKVWLSLADVHLTLTQDGRSVDMSVARVHLTTNAVLHRRLGKRCLDKIA